MKDLSLKGGHHELTLAVAFASPLKFDLFANNIEKSCLSNVENMFAASRRMSRALTAAAITQGATFPFVTFPMFEVYAKDARYGTGLELILYTPLIRDEQRSAFDRYAVEQQGWVNITRKGEY